MSDVPKLRFKEFRDQHRQEERLSERTNWFSGGTPSKKEEAYWNGGIPWISASSMYSDILEDSELKITQEGLVKGSRLAPKNSVLILVRGSMLFNKIPLGIAGKDIAFNQDVKAVVAKKNQYPRFLFYLLKSLEHKLLSMVVGTGIGAGKLETEELKNLPINFPSSEEQQKIVSFLTSVDEKISALQRRLELLQTYKRGVMRKLFSQEIRFKREDGSSFPDWEEKMFDEVFTRVTRKNTENNQNVLTISAQQGLINQEEYFNKSVSAKDVTGYYLLKSGEFGYNKSYSQGYPMGAIKRLKRYKKGVVSTLYICFKTKVEAESDFFEHYFDGGFLNREISKIAQEGARNHGLLNISVVEFFRDIVVSKPALEEQQKIATFLSAIDTKIDAVSQQISLTEQFKKGLLQQMFV